MGKERGSVSVSVAAPLMQSEASAAQRVRSSFAIPAPARRPNHRLARKWRVAIHAVRGAVRLRSAVTGEHRVPPAEVALLHRAYDDFCRHDGPINTPAALQRAVAALQIGALLLTPEDADKRFAETTARRSSKVVADAGLTLRQFVKLCVQLREERGREMHTEARQAFDALRAVPDADRLRGSVSIVDTPSPRDNEDLRSMALEGTLTSFGLAVPEAVTQLAQNRSIRRLRGAVAAATLTHSRHHERATGKRSIVQQRGNPTLSYNTFIDALFEGDENTDVAELEASVTSSVPPARKSPRPSGFAALAASIQTPPREARRMTNPSAVLQWSGLAPAGPRTVTTAGMTLGTKVKALRRHLPQQAGSSKPRSPPAEPVPMPPIATWRPTEDDFAVAPVRRAPPAVPDVAALVRQMPKTRFAGVRGAKTAKHKATSAQAMGEAMSRAQRDAVAREAELSALESHEVFPSGVGRPTTAALQKVVSIRRTARPHSAAGSLGPTSHVASRAASAGPRPQSAAPIPGVTYPPAALDLDTVPREEITDRAAPRSRVARRLRWGLPSKTWSEHAATPGFVLTADERRHAMRQRTHDAAVDTADAATHHPLLRTTVQLATSVGSIIDRDRSTAAASRPGSAAVWRPCTAQSQSPALMRPASSMSRPASSVPRPASGYAESSASVVAAATAAMTTLGSPERPRSALAVAATEAAHRSVNPGSAEAPQAASPVPVAPSAEQRPSVAEAEAAAIPAVGRRFWADVSDVARPRTAEA